MRSTQRYQYGDGALWSRPSFYSAHVKTRRLYTTVKASSHVKKNRISVGITLASAFFVAFLVVSMSLTTSVATTSAKPEGCFQFTINGQPIDTPYCNSKANDITIVFKPSPNCYISSSTLAQSCPKDANNIDVVWGMSATGTATILRCVWTHGKTILSTPCVVLTSPSLIQFEFSGLVIKVFWTLNGKRIGPVIVPPTIANDVEFSLAR